ncbi:hypothetical protein [Caulobacter sp. DWR1-3-2b1]|uniref:hypothetical protein n=1 Tax=Caulobacter sp. DWR1-3-2b1 TaxID=2804670 RepID=UPI003CE9D9DF
MLATFLVIVTALFGSAFLYLGYRENENQSANQKDRKAAAKRERRALYKYKEKNGLADEDDVRIGNHRAWLALNAEANVLRVMSYRPAKK